MRNNCILKVLNHQSSPRMPIWIMRQAGRYLPEYRAIREKAGSFIAMIKNPELVAEITLQPIKRFDLDAAIIFSDILTIPDAMGLGLKFEDGIGPSFKRPIVTTNDIDKLSVPDPEQDFKYLSDGIECTLELLQSRVPLIGFSATPITLARYMLQESPEHWINNHPQQFHQLMRMLSASIKQYLLLQANHGVSILQIFDSWGNHLSTPELYNTYAIPYITEIIQYLHNHAPEVPVIFYTRHLNMQVLEQIANIPHITALAVDSPIDIIQLRQSNPTIILQGNLNPSHLNNSAEELTQATKQVLQSITNPELHIFNLGQGITPSAKPELVAHLIDLVHQFET
ncbi:MAG: uroporphyrinogen decarboxylase [Methylacidiphilales bacterium]|nr:uroporphyrinogen decarboxylase [Candidatus Methylacidiphilales bacterium]